uniref:Putative secreted protein n=1 Tax=Ixodes ricinus TaxID=34613 RepID=A0A6B0UUP0_IXORI
MTDAKRMASKMSLCVSWAGAATCSSLIFSVASGRLCDSKKTLPRAVRTCGMLFLPLPWPNPMRENRLLEKPAAMSSLSTSLMVLSSSLTTSAWQASSSTTSTTSMLVGTVSMRVVSPKPSFSSAPIRHVRHSVGRVAMMEYFSSWSR